MKNCAPHVHVWLHFFIRRWSFYGLGTLEEKLFQIINTLWLFGLTVFKKKKMIFVNIVWCNLVQWGLVDFCGSHDSFGLRWKHAKGYAGCRLRGCSFPPWSWKGQVRKPTNLSAILCLIPQTHKEFRDQDNESSLSHWLLSEYEEHLNIEMFTQIRYLFRNSEQNGTVNS